MKTTKFFLFPILSFLILSPPTWSQIKTSYYLYQNTPIKLQERSFRVYIIPQLKIITQEYFHILKKLNPIHGETYELYKMITGIANQMKSINQICQNSKEKCQETLKKNYHNARLLDKKISSLQSKYIEISNKDKLLFTSSLDELALKNYKLLHKLEEYILTNQTNYHPYFLGRSEFRPILHSMLMNSEFMLTQMLHGEIKNDFDAVWMSFFKEINQRVIHDNDKTYLIKRLEELNLSWNTFHMKITKGHYDIPDHLIKLIKVMHNRWNSCLKIILH